MHNPFVETDEMREINDRVRKQSRTRQIGKSYGSINANQGMISAFKPIKRLDQRAPYHTNLQFPDHLPFWSCWLATRKRMGKTMILT